MMQVDTGDKRRGRSEGDEIPENWLVEGTLAACQRTPHAVPRRESPVWRPLGRKEGDQANGLDEKVSGLTTDKGTALFWRWELGLQLRQKADVKVGD